jgi:structural maintenance of chromosomes protein 6
LNGGDEGYKPELFGDVIIIERRFSKDGSSGYKIKAKNGSVVSTKREELQEILDHFNLQVDNPLTVLTQDTARQFLGNSSSHDKYKLFMRGVQLSQLDTDYTMVEAQISSLQTTLESKTVALNDLKEKEREWRMKVRIFERSAELEETIKNLQNQFAWSQVKDQEIVSALSISLKTGRSKSRRRSRTLQNENRIGRGKDQKRNRATSRKRRRSSSSNRCLPRSGKENSRTRD